MLFIRIDTLKSDPTKLNISEQPSPEGEWALCSENLERDIRDGKPITGSGFVIVRVNTVEIFPIRAWRTQDVREVKRG